MPVKRSHDFSGYVFVIELLKPWHSCERSASPSAIRASGTGGSLRTFALDGLRPIDWQRSEWFDDSSAPIARKSGSAATSNVSTRERAEEIREDRKEGVTGIGRAIKEIAGGVAEAIGVKAPESEPEPPSDRPRRRHRPE